MAKKIIGHDANQVPLNSDLGTAAYLDASSFVRTNKDINVDAFKRKIWDANFEGAVRDIFIYDTTLDSDGGAWRKNAKGKSWYNEELNTYWEGTDQPMRGSRRDFPQVAIIVATATAVYIFDADGDTPEFWMYFQGGEGVGATRGALRWWGISEVGEVSSVRAWNGVLYVGTNKGSSNGQYVGVAGIDFIADYVWHRRQSGGQYSIYNQLTIARRNDTAGGFVAGEALYGQNGFYAGNINRIELHKPKGAQLDEYSGLPKPWLLLAQGTGNGGTGNGALHILRDDGQWVRHIQGSSNCAGGFILENEKTGDNFTLLQNAGSYFAIFPTYADVTTGYIGSAGYPTYSNGIGAGRLRTGVNICRPVWDGDIVSTANSGVEGSLPSGATHYPLNFTSHTFREYTGQEQDMGAFIGHDYSTGWMPGTCYYAMLNSTERTPSGYNGRIKQYVTDPTFKRGISNWTAFDNATISHSSGRYLHIQRNSGSSSGRIMAYQQLTGLTVGDTYTVEVAITNATPSTAGHFEIWESTNFPSTTLSSLESLAQAGPIEAGNHTLTFTATETTAYVSVGARSSITAVVDYEFVSIVNHREYNRTYDNHLRVFPASPDAKAEVRKFPVDENSELMAYQPVNNSDGIIIPRFSGSTNMDFGSGDFCISFWFKNTSDATSDMLFSKLLPTAGAGNAGIAINATSGDNIGFATYTDGLTSSGRVNCGFTFTIGQSSEWNHLVALRRSNKLEFWLNGRLDPNTTYSTANISNNTDAILLGYPYDTSSSIPNSSTDAWVTLFRAGITAPGHEQIKKMYEEEKMMLNKDSKVSLLGTDTYVNDISYDPIEEVLHTINDQYRCVFNKFVRIDEDETHGSSSKVHAINGMVVER